jgi:hypothetical protein
MPFAWTFMNTKVIRLLRLWSRLIVLVDRCGKETWVNTGLSLWLTVAHRDGRGTW